MATTTFSEFVDSVIVDYSKLAEQGKIESFTQRRQMFSACQLFKKLNDEQQLFDPYINNQVKNAVQTPVLNSQNVVLQNIYGNKATSVPGAPPRIDASGNVNVYPVRLDYFNNNSNVMYNSGLSVSRIASIIQQSGTRESMLEKDSVSWNNGRIHMAKLFKQAILDIYSQLENDLQNFLLASRWQVSTTPDLGTLYSPVAGNYKQIPVSQVPFSDPNTIPEWLHSLAIEREENAFGQTGRCHLYMTTGMKKALGRYLYMGGNNQQNEEQEIAASGFNFHWALRATNAVPTDLGNLLMIDGGAVMMYQKAPLPMHESPFTGERNGVTMGNDTWAPPIAVGAGTNIMPDMPRLELSVKEYKSWFDNSATYNVEHANNDQLMSTVFSVKCGAYAAQDVSNTNIRSVLGYRVF